MAELFVLEDRIGQCVGLYSTLEAAMDAYYLWRVYGIYQGETRELAKTIWREYMDLKWSAYREREGLLGPMMRGLPVAAIRRVVIDRKFVLEDNLRRLAQTLPSRKQMDCILPYED